MLTIPNCLMSIGRPATSECRRASFEIWSPSAAWFTTSLAAGSCSAERTSTSSLTKASVKRAATSHGNSAGGKASLLVGDLDFHFRRRRNAISAPTAATAPPTMEPTTKGGTKIAVVLQAAATRPPPPPSAEPALTEALVFGFLMPHRAEAPKTRSQQHLARRATPVLDSIQLHRVPEGRLNAAPADVLPVQRLGRRILPSHPNMGPVDQSRRIPSSCE